MHQTSLDRCEEFIRKYLSAREPLRIADVGSYDVNGTYRVLLNKPRWQYTGMDVAAGPNVDVVVDEHAETWPGAGTFDVVISGQCVEHVRRPWRWIKQVAALARPAGLVWITGPNTWGFHEYPIDCWRIWPDGLRALFDEADLRELECGYLGTETVGIAYRPVASVPKEVGDLFFAACRNASDINEHCGTLFSLASGVRRITEFGSRDGNSTAAFLAAWPDSLTCYQNNAQGQPRKLEQLSHGRMRMINDSIHQVDIAETDLLFIDSEHTYAQLTAELQRHAHQVQKWIVLHDTTTFGTRGEDGGPGLWPAVEEFLSAHPEWSVKSRVHHNHGLTILERHSVPGGTSRLDITHGNASFHSGKVNA